MKKSRKDYMKQFEISDDDLGKVVAGLGEPIIDESVFGMPSRVTVVCRIGENVTNTVCSKFVPRKNQSANPAHPCFNCIYSEADIVDIPDVIF